MIYLDNAATTQMFTSTFDEMRKVLVEDFFNPSATYREGVKIQKFIDSAKESLAKVIGGSNSGKIVFVGSATEANNLAIFGTCKNKVGQYLFSEGEHPSVYNCALELKNRGYDVKFVPLSNNGEVDYGALETLLKAPTNFVSCMAVNNETGAINDLRRIGELRSKFASNAIFHADIVQAFCKIPLNVQEFGIDIASMSAHKIHGPKGIGALWFSSKVKLKPIVFGGGQENGIRSGTENVGYIAAFKHVVNEFQNIKENLAYVQTLKDSLLDNLSGIDFENNSVCGSPYIVSLSFAGVRGETLVNMLDEKGVVVSTGSACSSKKVGNRVLSAMGQKNIIGSIRVSFSWNTSQKDVVVACEEIKKAYKLLFEKTH